MYRRLMLLAVLVAATFGSDAEILATDHGVRPNQLNTTWQVRRDFDDPGVWGETAVILHVKTVTKTVVKGNTIYKAKGSLNVYKPNQTGDRHKLVVEIDVKGFVKIKGLGERKRLIVVWRNKMKEEVAALTFVRGKEGSAEHRRSLLRLYKSKVPPILAEMAPSPKNGHCDEPPDDDVLEPMDEPLDPDQPPPEDIGP